MGRTALSLAASGGHSHIVALLLQQKGLDVSAADTFKETVLYYAARNGHEQVIMYLYKDPRARIGSDVKRAIKAASSSKIARYL